MQDACNNLKIILEEHWQTVQVAAPLFEGFTVILCIPLYQLYQEIVLTIINDNFTYNKYLQST